MSYSKIHPINVIGLCGSLRKDSTTHAALTIALKGAEETGASVELLDLSEYELIFYGAVDEKSDYPPDVIKLKQKVAEAHGVLLGTPEYHGSFSGIIKNTLDLMGSEEFQNKVVGLIGVSGGRMGAGSALSMLRIVCTSLRAWVVPNDVSIARASEAFDENGCLNDAELEMRLRTIGGQVAEYAARWNSD